MNKSISLNMGLQKGVLIKNDITILEKNTNSMKSKFMNDPDRKFKNRNFPSQEEGY